MKEYINEYTKDGRMNTSSGAEMAQRFWRIMIEEREKGKGDRRRGMY